MALMHKPLQHIQERKPEENMTLDMDTTFMPARQSVAPFKYKGEHFNRVYNVSRAEQDMILHCKYVASNVSSRSGQPGLFRRSLKHLPPGAKRVKLRTDSTRHDT